MNVTTFTSLENLLSNLDLHINPRIVAFWKYKTAPKDKEICYYEWETDLRKISICAYKITTAHIPNQIINEYILYSNFQNDHKYFNANLQGSVYYTESEMLRVIDLQSFL